MIAEVWNPEDPIEVVFGHIKTLSLSEARAKKQASEAVIRQVEHELAIYRRIADAYDARIKELNQ